MIKKRSILMIIATFFAIVFAMSVLAIFPVKKANAESISFYDEKAAPIFYGATKITISKDAVDTFSVKDSRFRVFATDYEDGDVTPNIVCEFNNVNPKVSGNYTVKYSVTDKHGNKASLSVLVTVLDQTGGTFVIERTVYAVPKMENMLFIGTERCNPGDRQILGIFVPEGASFKARSLSNDAENNFVITFFTNTITQNSILDFDRSTGDYSEIKNERENKSYAAVPLITSPRLSEEKVGVTYKIELSYDNTVKPLDYYHYKDDESAFIISWKESKSEFGVVDGEAMLVIVPFADVDKLSNYKASGYNAPFESLDAFFEYYLEVVNKMDEWIGLSFKPTSWLNRNYRTKYTCAADGSKSGIGAYYEKTFIAVGSYTVAPFFQYGWGTLHEIGHGYQGFLGRGNTKGMNLGLNETGNNVLAYYIQNDRTLYKGTDNWLGGTLDKVEESKNKLRLEGKEVFVATSTYANASEKLYALVNLFNAFEGANTYGKLFSYYRALAYEKDVNAFTVPDIYAKFFSEEYGANVIPYLKAWGLVISDEVDMLVSSKNLMPYVIPSDVVGNDEAKDMVKNGKISLLYGVNSEKSLELNSKASFTVNVDIDDFNVLKGKRVVLYKGDKLVENIWLEKSSFTVNNLKVGVYRLLMPALISYDSNNPSFVVTTDSQKNTLNISYTKAEIKDRAFHTKLRLIGVHGTEGFSLDLMENNTKAKANLGAADMGNQNAYWSGKPNDVFASVTILNQNGEIVEEYAIKGKGYFFQLKDVKTELDLEYGYTIKVFTNKPEKVGVWATFKDKQKEIVAYKTTKQTTSYLITEYGLKKLGEEFDEKQILYNEIRDELIGEIDEYKNNISNDYAKNLRLDKEKKREILANYNSLSDEDKKEYKDFCDKLRYGNALKVAAKESKVAIKSGEKIDLLSLITITDFEGNIVGVDSVYVMVETKLNTSKEGVYQVKYVVADYDGGKAEATVQVEVSGKSNKGLIIGLSVGTAALLVVVVITIVAATKSKSGKKSKKV